MSIPANKAIRYFLLPLLWAIALGVVGFLAGFLGPMALNPGANQGPMLGIFMTGPGGFILGGIIGFLCAEKNLGWRRQLLSLLITGIIGGGAILLFCVVASFD